MSVLVVTIENVPGYRVARILGTVFGVSVRSRNVFGNAIGSIRAAFGGNQAGYAKLVSDNREAALEDMMNQAEEAGANAVVMARFDSGEFAAGRGQAMNEVVAYGTAVVLELDPGQRAVSRVEIKS